MILGFCFGTDLVSKTLRGDDSDLIADPLVGFEVECELGVVAFDDDLRGFLDGLDNVSLMLRTDCFSLTVPLCERDPYLAMLERLKS